MDVAPVVIAVMVLIAASIWAVQWGRIRRAEVDLRLKQDMLARGLSIEEIERLVRLSPRPDPPGLSRPTRRPTEAALAVASAIGSMLEAGNSEGIAPLLGAFWFQSRGPSKGLNPTPQQTEPSLRESVECSALASALESMFEVGKEPEEIAAFLDVLLQRHDEPQETSREPNEPPAADQAGITAIRSI